MSAKCGMETIRRMGKVCFGSLRNRWGRSLPGLVLASRNYMKRPGQGTVEFAILVGVLVVIAILAITVFRPKVQELCDAIASGINGL